MGDLGRLCLFWLDFMSSLKHGWPWTTLFCLDFMSSLRHGWPWTTLAILFRLDVLPQAWVTLDDFGYSVYTLCPPSSMGDLVRLWLFCLDFMSSLKHGWPWTTLAILFRLYVLPKAWVTLDDFVLFRLYVLPQAWVTLDDFGYSV